MLRLLVVTFLLVLLGASVSSPALAQQPPTSSDVFSGAVPSGGGIALVATRGEMPIDESVRALRAAGCEPLTVAITRDGRWQLYAPGAPPFANASFPLRLEAGRVAAVRCMRPEVPDAHLLRLVSKAHGLPPNFVPDDLVPLSSQFVLLGTGPAYLTEEAADALEQMLEAGREVGHEILVRSAYRSYQEQVVTHEYWIDVLGEEEAARRSAPGGHSEHQLGTVVDVASAAVGWSLEPEFADTAEGQWLRRRAHDFGFVESYPEGTEAITSYRHEPWHWRYIGKLHADWVRQTGLTLIEYLEKVHAAD